MLKLKAILMMMLLTPAPIFAQQETPPLNEDIAIFAGELSYSHALLKKQLDSGNEEYFRTNEHDLQEMVSRFDEFSNLVDSLDELVLGAAIENGANEIEPEESGDSDCHANPNETSARCQNDSYERIERNPIISRSQITTFSGITSTLEEAGNPAPAKAEQRNLIVLATSKQLAQRRSRLQELIDNGLVSNMTLRDLAHFKKSFSKYRSAMDEYIGRLSGSNSQENSQEISQDQQCGFNHGDLEFDCHGERFVIVPEGSVGERSSETLAQADGARISVEDSLIEGASEPHGGLPESTGSSVTR